ncbi:PLIN5 protein, partial [Formicarius rufipectus]|nr:PLIN5 protein [Formicarius rufipectus]
TGAPQVEAPTPSTLRGLLHQLHGTCAHLASGAHALPSSVQETSGHVQHGMKGVEASLARASSCHDLPGSVVARARLGIDELLGHVGQRAPLPWLVGPFAPALVETPEGIEVEMAKWEGCATVG